MGYSPQKIALKKKKSGHSLFSGVRYRWLQKWPVLVFVLGFAALMIVFYAIWLSKYFNNTIQPHIISVNAGLSCYILNIFGMKTMVMKDMISSSLYSISITRGCDAVEAMALFVSALLAFPAKWNYKLVGFLAGIAVLFIVNIGRIISLFLTGIYFPKAFEFIHVEVWQVLFIFFGIGLWAFWIKWTRERSPHAA